ncbi:MAG: hypothetical protein JOY82_15955 [Streptosporangiaceae bacterium]|nr:hypothetical protein [Streptosporangiaceae bacterium]MBV9855986.1 hypothetical protein [Streptosporangiaceae bacterium]
MRTRSYGALLGAAMLAGMTACASSSTPAGGFQPAGGPATPASAPAYSAAEVATAHFPFPSGIHIDFQTPLPSGLQPARAAVTYENYQLAYYYAIYSRGESKRYLSYLYRSDVPLVAAAQASVRKYDGEGFTGTLRFYDMTVQPTPGQPGGLDVSACVNQQRLFSTDRATGRVIPGQSTAPAGNVSLETYSLDELEGSWKIVAIASTYYPHGAAKGCYP